MKNIFTRKRRLLAFFTAAGFFTGTLFGAFPAAGITGSGNDPFLQPVSVSAAAVSAPTSLWVDPSETNGIADRIDVFKAQTGGTSTNPSYTWQLYLPGSVDPANCSLSWDGGMQATVDGVAYDSGACPVPPVNTEKTYAFRNGSQTAASFKVITYQGSTNVQPVFIEIDETGDNPTIAQMDGDKNHNVTCTGRINIGGQWYGMPKIKGRGNVSWSQADDKRPYNITLDSKINFPGIDCTATKKWTFLAEILDHSLLCNRSGFHLAHEMGIGQDTASADVWMNGEYQGCYSVTPKTDSYVTKNGFMVEQDNYKEDPVADGGDPQFTLDGLKEASGWSSCYNRITVKKMGDNLLKNAEGVVDESPSNLETVANGTIRPWLQEAWDAIRSDSGYNSKGKYYTDYIDIESFAQMYLLQEYIKNYDVCAGSLLYYRDGMNDTDKLIAGPAWDLDNALGATYQNSSLGSADDRKNGDRRSAEGHFIPNITEYKTSIYKTLSRHDDFMKEVNRQYNKNRSFFDDLPDATAQMISDIEASARMNHIKVKDLSNNIHKYSSNTTLGSGQYRQTYLATTSSKSDWGNYAANLKTFITTRTLWFKNNYYDPSYVDPATCQHQYEAVRVEPTCTAEGSITYTCPVCGDSYTESIPIIAHDYQDDICTICGQALLHVTVDCDQGASVTVYETQSPDSPCIENASSVNPRNSDTGMIDCSGDGQVNFTVNLKPGYQLSAVTAEPSGSYKNLKLPADTGIENGYRLTKVKGDAVIHVTTLPGAQVFGHTLTLNGQIGLNTYLVFSDTITENPDRYQVEFWDGETLAFSSPVSEADTKEKEVEGVTYTTYLFSTTTVAKEMKTVFTMKIRDLSTDNYIDFADYDSSLVEGNEGLDYSITDYLEEMNGPGGSADPDMTKLAVDMNDYGVYAKHYFDVRDRDSEEELPEIDGFEVIIADTLEEYKSVKPDNIDGFTYKGTTLVLEEDTSFRMYFESDQPENLTIRYKEADLETEEKDLEIRTGKGMYFVEIPGITARNLNKMYDFTIINNAVDGSTTAHHGPMGYAYWALSTSKNENLQYLMMGLYHYNQSAIAYFKE